MSEFIKIINNDVPIAFIGKLPKTAASGMIKNPPAQRASYKTN
jgi:hypothetical protein